MVDQFIIDILPVTPSSIPLRKCAACGRIMRFVGSEPHPTINKSDVYTFECACGALDLDSVVRH